VELPSYQHLIFGNKFLNHICHTPYWQTIFLENNKCWQTEKSGKQKMMANKKV
jgi:hypothetical protein